MKLPEEVYQPPNNKPDYLQVSVADHIHRQLTGLKVRGRNRDKLGILLHPRHYEQLCIEMRYHSSRLDDLQRLNSFEGAQLFPHEGAGPYPRVFRFMD